MQAGLSAVMLGLLRRSGFAMPLLPPPRSGIGAFGLPRPFVQIPSNPASIMVDGLPFASSFTGDDFPPGGAIPFHSSEVVFPGGQLPAAKETVDIVIIGGGLSGLTTAYLLRDHLPVVLELRSRFGGVSQGEIWNDTYYSLGGAYFITPDKGSFLESLYIELGLDKVYRLSQDDELAELGGAIDADFWTGAGLSPSEQEAFKRYATLVQYYARDSYPEIPLPGGKDNAWIIALDQLSLKQDIEQRLGMKVPTLLASGIQSYCYSSFNAGWEEISAASGWNFIAAEEYGRWVCPGGNTWVVDVLWQQLVEHYAASGVEGVRNRLRPGHRAVDVRSAPRGLIQVTYKDQAGQFHSLLARRVVMANSKHICKYMLPELEKLDLDKLNAMYRVSVDPYVVANVLLDAPIDVPFYDIFLLGDGHLPMSDFEVALNSRVTDVVSGHYAAGGGPKPPPQSVLTLYWPLPWGHAVFGLIADTAMRDYAATIVPQITGILDLLKVPRSAVRQVRLTRWGHAMPIALPTFIADGVPQELRRPFLDHVYFANQDNWALPAFETCLLEAQYTSELIERSL